MKTDKGRVRNYNEDRVSIVVNIKGENEGWPKCCFFGIYDGHGGSGCADYLRDNLHSHIFNNPHFPNDVSTALL